MTQAEKPSLLFVDDEENVLRGLGRMLRAKRNVWDMRFAAGGTDALQMMLERPADVVVSDMRMPGMSGAELLTTVQKIYPQTIRIVLSGFAEREAILRTIGPSHRYLAKPASEEILTASIENALALRQHLFNQSVQLAVAGMTHLPSLPDIYSALIAELNSDIGSAERLASIIEKDISVTAMLMKLTNSAYFSLPQKCLTVRQAINFLGFENIRATVLLAGVFDQFKQISPSMGELVKRLMQRSLAIGVLAQAIGRAEGWKVEICDEAFCAGLLAHVGTLMLIAQNSTEFMRSMRHVDAREMTLVEAETDAFGASHARLGAYLLGLWGFTDSIVEAVAFHHDPSAYTNRPIEAMMAVHVAQYLVRHRTGEETAGAGGYEGLDIAYCDAAGIFAKLPAWTRVYENLSGGWPHE
jgi:HD-like signal output (HDOD) protein/CheY-like chemotaxis protein